MYKQKAGQSQDELVGGYNSFESIMDEDVKKQMTYDRPNEGRYTKRSKERVDGYTRGVLMGCYRECGSIVVKALCCKLEGCMFKT
jgi:hypothetical protein